MSKIKQKIIQTEVFQYITAELYHRKIQKKLIREFSDIIEKYKNVDAEKKEYGGEYSQYIWVCWWQGYDGMTPLVKECVDRIKKFNSDKKVVLITEENLNEYVTFPTYILEKFKAGLISKTHMSDLLRANLLAKYGGCWMDATLYLFGGIPEHFYDVPIYTGRYARDKKDYNVSKSRWTSYFLMARYPGNVLYCFLMDFWNEYWKKYDSLITYFMIDYAINLAYQTVPFVRYELDLVDENGCGKNPWELLKALPNVYDELWIKELEEQNWMQKLTYKVEDTVQIKARIPEKSIYNKLFFNKDN